VVADAVHLGHQQRDLPPAFCPSVPTDSAYSSWPYELRVYPVDQAFVTVAQLFL